MIIYTIYLNLHIKQFAGYQCNYTTYVIQYKCVQTAEYKLHQLSVLFTNTTKNDQNMKSTVPAYM